MVENPASRLKSARIKAGHSSMAEAARAADLPYTTYVNYEKADRDIDQDTARRLAKAFGIDPIWLMFGRGKGNRIAGQIPVMGMVGAGAVVAAPTDEGYVDPVDFVDTPDPESVFAYIVQGESQWPRFMSGDIILASRDPQNPDKLLNRTAIVENNDGEKMVKKIVKGRRTGMFTLWSHNAPEMEDVLLRAAYPIMAVIVRS